MLMHIFISQVVVGVLLGIYVLVSLSRTGWRRWGAPTGLALTYASMLLITLSSLGQARPVAQVPVLGAILWGAALHADDYEIRAIKLVENQGIFLFLVPKDGNDPLLVRVSWDQQKAEELYKRMSDEEVSAKGYPKFGMSVGGFDEHEPLFYDLRHDEQPPPKTGG
jgi:hypothetical protein